MEILPIEAEYCPQAVVEWYQGSTNKKNKFDSSKAKKHLVSVGWVIWYGQKGQRRELRYSSPDGKCYYSLRTACKGCIDDGGASETVSSNPVSKSIVSQRVSEPCSVSQRVSEPCSASQRVVDSGCSVSQRVSEPCSASQRVVDSGSSDSQRVSSESINVGDEVKEGEPTGIAKRKRGKVVKDLRKMRKDSKPTRSSQPNRVPKSNRRTGDASVNPGSSSHRNPPTVLSWLVDNNVVLPRARVHYRGRKGEAPLKTGHITRDGIECDCCGKVFNLSRFEGHAGSTKHRPAANIILEDGRSLFDCQNKIINTTSITEKGNFTTSKLSDNDDVCSICRYGGELLLCDQCPASFHKSCLGLEDVPDGDWFCTSCCCGLCRQRKFPQGTDQQHSTDESFLDCKQCQRKYHIGCLRSKGVVNLESYNKGNWFCGSKCEGIFLGLGNLLGKRIPVGVYNLTWTLVKPMDSETCNPDDALDVEASTENHSKLSLALSVMHECFEPVKDPYTNRDIVEDVIFSRGSELIRLNYRGFYTVLLERDDELITVATLRIHGEKVAELPLVATRFQFRRLGMCSILMNELERQLGVLGVERLVLPAAPSVLDTWTTSFGFSQMTGSERVQFLDYSLLDFQDTIMCQKLLKKNLAAESTPSDGIRPPEVCNDVYDNICSDGPSAIAEVSEAQYSNDSEILDKGLADSAAGHDQINSLWLVEEANFQQEGRHNSGGYSKCYKRRKVAACNSQVPLDYEPRRHVFPVI